jgi:hypothetical protein
VAAQVVVMALYGLWMFAVNVAIDPDALTAISGTALAPLADEIGPIVHVLGSLFVILAMGIGSIHNSLGLFNLDRERLPICRRGPTTRIARRTCFLLSAAPVLIVFLLVQWMLLTDSGSFAEPLSFVGVIVMSLLGGIFPMLLLMASRHKGTFVPGVAFRALGRRAIATGIALLYLVGLFLHGLVIWQDPLQQAAALAVGVMTLGGTVRLAQQGKFATPHERLPQVRCARDPVFRRQYGQCSRQWRPAVPAPCDDRCGFPGQPTRSEVNRVNTTPIETLARVLLTTVSRRRVVKGVCWKFSACCSVSLAIL